MPTIRATAALRPISLVVVFIGDLLCLIRPCDSSLAARRRSLHRTRVPGTVILDLEVQERVDGGERIRITRDDPHTPTGSRFLVSIVNAILESRHIHGPWHLLRV